MKKLFNPSDLPTPCEHSKSCPAAMYSNGGSCTCQCRKKMLQRLNPATLAKKGPWKGSLVSITADGFTKLTHPSGAILVLSGSVASKVY